MIPDQMKQNRNKKNPRFAIPKIVRKKCTGCGLCTEICLVYEKHNTQISIAKPEICIRCGHCGSFCPSNAIKAPGTESRRLTDVDQALIPSPESLQFLFRSRRSVRRYKRKAVSRKDINKILEAGRYTPTGLNSQGIRYIVITDPDRIARLRAMTLPAVMKLFGIAERLASLPFSSYLLGEEFKKDLESTYSPGLKLLNDRTMRGDDRLFYHAPAIMLVHGAKVDDMAFSCPVALYNCSMMAHTLGIGCCLNGFLVLAANHNTRIKKWLGIPRAHKCYGAMTFGYQDVTYNALVKRNAVNVRWL